MCRFFELSALAAWNMYGGKAHSASVITGIGVVHGRECMFIANDSTINGGAFYPETLKKIIRAQEIAERCCVHFRSYWSLSRTSMICHPYHGRPTSGEVCNVHRIMSGFRTHRISPLLCSTLVPAVLWLF